MAFQPSYFDDGDDLSTKLNGFFSDATTELNGLDELSIARACFTGDHGGGLLSNLATVVSEDDTTRTYNFGTFGSSIVYATFGNDGGSEDNGDIGTADRCIVGHEGSSSANSAEIVLPAANEVGMSNSSIAGYEQAGILLLGNVELYNVAPDDLTGLYFMLCFRYTTTGGTYTINTSERFWNVTHHHLGYSSELTGDPMWLDCSIMEFLGPNVVDAKDDSGNPVTKVQMMMSLKSAAGSGGAQAIQLRNWNFSAIGLYSGDIS